MDPLSEPQIHRAIRAIDAGDRPARATLRTALLMALAWHAAQAEIAALRGRVTQLETDRETAYATVGNTMEVVDQLVEMIGGLVPGGSEGTQA